MAEQEQQESNIATEHSDIPVEADDVLRMGQGTPDNLHAGFSSALDQRDSCSCRWCSRCYSNRSTCMILLLLFVVFCITVYFVVPWVPVAEDVLDWVDGRGSRGILLLFFLHQLALYAIVGPVTTLEYCWVFLRGWHAAPWIVLSYVLGIATMLYIGNTILRPCILRRVRDNPLMQATQRVLDQQPYMWYIAFQFWSLVPWRASVYCAHVLAPHAYLSGIGVAVLIGQLPSIFYGIFLATRITDLDSLVTGRLDTPRDTGIFWGSVIVNLLISLILYVKIRTAFAEAAGMAARRHELETADVSLAPTSQARDDQ